MGNFDLFLQSFGPYCNYVKVEGSICNISKLPCDLFEACCNFGGLSSTEKLCQMISKHTISYYPYTNNRSKHSNTTLLGGNLG